MKRIKSKAGFTLVEVMVTILILLMLYSGVVIAMDVGGKIYRESIFESHSSLLAESLNNHLGDILGNASEITVNDGIITDDYGKKLYKEDVPMVFTNSSYGAQDAYLTASPVSPQTLVIKGLHTTDAYQLVNTGTYPDLAVTNFKITYHAKSNSTTDGTGYGGYCTIQYTIQSTNNSSLSKEVNTVVRLLNDP
jgi:prepilin-type N-terminal cleavage/methylation domain-containing protein